MANDEDSQVDYHQSSKNLANNADSSRVSFHSLPGTLNPQQSTMFYDNETEVLNYFEVTKSNETDHKSIEVLHVEHVPQDSANVDRLLSNSLLAKNSARINSSNGQDDQNVARDFYSPSARLLPAASSEGIFERISLLNQLLMVEKSDVIPDYYDEMKAIELSIRRNAQIQAGPYGQTLLDLATAAVSNRNWDLNRFGAEIERQFGLYSVEVVGDGACAFRAMIISGMAQMDGLYHVEVREHTIEQVLKNKAYYATVLRPGSKASDEELLAWAKSMNDLNTYADELANIAMADYYHVQLVIFRAGELLTVINPRDGHVTRTAFLINVGTHYKALVTKAELREAQQNSERLNGIEH